MVSWCRGYRLKSREAGVTRFLSLALVVVIISACGARPPANTLLLSGVIEATQASVVAEVGGRVVGITADEGDTVEKDQALVQLDDATSQVQIKQAQAAVRAAEATLAQVKAGARSEEIAAAQAALVQAQAERDGAAAAYKDALTILHNPQQITAQLDAARTAAQLAEQNVAVAQSKLAEARWWREFHDDDKGQRHSLDDKIAIAQHDLEAAQAQLDGAKAQVTALATMRNAPLMLNSQVNQALGAFSMTLASVPVAEAALAELRAGPTAEEVALAEARLHQAQAQLQLAQAQLGRTCLRAPLAGIIAARSAHVGEMVQPGIALMTIMNLDQVNLTLYVPEAQLPRVRLGAPVQVNVDAYPGQTFTGEVISIAHQAQFAARDTQAREDRANLVFAVKARMPNAHHRLKPGMTADATILLQ